MPTIITTPLVIMAVALPILLLVSGCSNHSAPTPTVNAAPGAQPASMPSVPPGVTALQQLKQNAMQQQQAAH